MTVAGTSLERDDLLLNGRHRELGPGRWHGGGQGPESINTPATVRLHVFLQIVCFQQRLSISIEIRRGVETRRLPEPNEDEEVKSSPENKCKAVPGNR
jgi:hypothetical protein